MLLALHGRAWWIQDGAPAQRSIIVVIACVPYSLVMWSVLGMPQNGHHGHQTLRQCTSFSGNTSRLSYVKPYHKLYRTLGSESPEVIIALRRLRHVRTAFDVDAMRAESRELRLKTKKRGFQDSK